MQVYELRLKVYLLKEIRAEEGLKEVGKLIDQCLCTDEKYSNFHKINRYKNYVFNGFHPIEEDCLYKAGHIYSVQIRTVDKQLMGFFKTKLCHIHNEEMKALTIQVRTIQKKLIEKIYTLTPLIIRTHSGKYWRDNDSVDIFEKQLFSNLVKQYNVFYKVKLDENFEFSTYLNLDNRKPIGIPYKNIKLIGDKITLTIAENESAQKLAYFSLGVGLGELGARGCGFVNYKGY